MDALTLGAPYDDQGGVVQSLARLIDDTRVLNLEVENPGTYQLGLHGVSGAVGACFVTATEAQEEPETDDPEGAAGAKGDAAPIFVHDTDTGRIDNVGARDLFPIGPHAGFTITLELRREALEHGGSRPCRPTL